MRVIRNFKHNSLLTKIFVLEIIIFGMFFYFAYINSQIVKDLMNKIENKRIESFINGNSEILADAIYFGFEEAIKENLKTALKLLKNIKGIHLTDIINNREYGFFETNTDPFKNRYKMFSYRKFDILKNNKVVGNLKVVYENSFAKEYYARYKYILMFLVFMFAIILGIAHFYMYKKIKVFYSLASYLEEIELKNLRPYISSQNYYEISLIVKSINNFIKRIKENTALLERLNRRLIENRTHMDSAQKIANFGSWEYIPSKNRFFASAGMYRLLKTKRTELDWEKFLSFICVDDKKIFEEKISKAILNKEKTEMIIRMISKDKKIRYLKTEFEIRERKKQSLKVIGISMDITEEMDAKNRIEFLVFHDPVTMLLNRRAFLDRVDYVIKLTKRKSARFAIFYLDLDNFKFVNDTFGHSVGDRLLIEIAKILKENLRETDVISRIGGDEFIILVSDIVKKEHIGLIAQKIIKSIAKEYHIKSYNFFVTASLGVSVFPDDSNNKEELIKYADAAMYEAKKEGRNKYKFFDMKIKNLLESRYEIISDLKEALNRENEILLYFQPKIDIKTEKVVSAEVLTRWNHPTKGLLFPNQYIPVTETTNLIIKYDDFVIKRTFQQIKEWENDSLLSDINLSVNISARQFKSKEFLVNLEKLKKDYKIEPSKIEFEVTETLAMENIEESIAILEKIKSLGFKISIDDFGTGYSSLNYLKNLTYDIIKIDREFIKDLHIDKDDVIITKLIVQMAKTLNKKIVAEGVELEKHVEILKDIDCDFAQGYYYSKPVPKKDFIEFCKSLSSHS